jgi:hypothetical protein
MIRKLKVLSIVLLSFAGILNSQDLSKLIEEIDDDKAENSIVLKTFRTPRIVNMHSGENPPPGEMIFNIGHRFGKINTGFYEMFGLDNATMRLGLDFGLTDWLGAGVGRSTFQKTIDVYVKARIIGQGGLNQFPFSVTYYGSGSFSTLRGIYPPDEDNFSGRLSIVNSLLFARKFGEGFSLQINPIWLRSNYLPEIQSSADDLSIGMAARIRILQRVHLNLEYIHEIIDDKVDDKNPLSVGFDLETGGHVFQLFFSSTQGIFDKAYLINTNETWSTGGVYFGFNITRVFYLR